MKQAFQVDVGRFITAACDGDEIRVGCVALQAGERARTVRVGQRGMLLLGILIFLGGAVAGVIVALIGLYGSGINLPR